MVQVRRYINTTKDAIVVLHIIIGAQNGLFVYTAFSEILLRSGPIKVTF